MPTIYELEAKVESNTATQKELLEIIKFELDDIRQDINLLRQKIKDKV